MPAPHVIDPTQLDLSTEELTLLRQGQSALAGSSSSRAASRASSQGRMLLDSNSLAALDVYFERVMNHIQQQLQYLTDQTQAATMAVYDQSNQMIVDADAEIARFTMINEQIDELELDFDRIAHIREIVHDFRQRIEDIEHELEHSQPSSSSRHRDGRRSEGHSSRHHRR
ncbi:hypothetical protein CMQ_4772 [Grosmannia clavigera kw1407]|uniref:Biogenesis of lysosome-related organelles complex 1 subunit CNL1 n=1 Tax=Grosmannia clavigera (strain kw1407 / UAMH 11150) TaxID=655863 RepID=F0XUP4_GROCL|nr:uncharacterized protein CMQ_4772 [Grosmannia clavigera kw1407]EFW98920.1 hypothetical protein CMQ_4772 [Grosmannia clavigera kw1407]